MARVRHHGSPTVIVLDAAVVIAVLDADDAHHEAASTLLLENAASGFVMNSLNLAEALVGPTRRGRGAEARNRLDALGICTVELPADAGPELAQIRVATGSKMPDCCLLLTARQVHGQVATFDERLRTSAAQLGLELV